LPILFSRQVQPACICLPSEEFAIFDLRGFPLPCSGTPPGA